MVWSLTRHVFLEGADGSGKSTLFQELATKYDLPHGYHAGGPPKDREEMLQRLTKIEDTPPSVIDRYAPLSELIYKSAFKQPLMLKMSEIFDYIERHRPVIVMCRPPRSVILTAPIQVKAHKPEEHVKNVMMNRGTIIDLYDFYGWYLRPISTFITYDWTSDHPQDLVERLVLEGVICVD